MKINVFWAPHVLLYPWVSMLPQTDPNSVAILAQAILAQAILAQAILAQAILVQVSGAFGVLCARARGLVRVLCV